MTPSESEQESIRRRCFKLIKARALRFLLCLPGTGNVRYLIEPDLPVVVRATVAETLDAVRPHSVSHIRTDGHVALELAHAVFPIGGFHLLGLAFDNDPSAVLLVIIVRIEDDQIGSWFTAAYPNYE